MKKYIIIIALMAMYICAFAQIGTCIPSDRLPASEDSWWEPVEQVLPWQNAGCLKQLEEQGGFEVTLYQDVSELDQNDLKYDIEYLINTNPDESILFFFPSGLYEFAETINISGANNIIFKGAGSDETTLKFTKPWRTSSVNGTKERYNFINVNGSQYIGFEDFKIDVIDPIIVQYPLDEEYAGIYINYTNSSHCWISGAEFYKAPRHHVYIKQSDHIEIRGSYFNNAWDHGGNGNGYGVQLFGPETTHCLIENNIYRKLRHAFVFSEEAKYNVIGYNYERDAHTYDLLFGFDYIEGQICFHGAQGYVSNEGPEYNLCEGNIIGHIEVDDAHGTNGSFNTMFRNRSYDMGIQIEHENEYVNIVNNYFKGDSFDETAAGFPWIVHDGHHLRKNNKCHDYWGYFWHDHSPSYWDDFSYYYTSRPDFIPVEQWPYHPTDSDPYGNNNSNPARDRWYASGNETVPASWDNITSDCHVTGNVFLQNGNGIINEVQIIFEGYENNFTISPDSNGKYSTPIQADCFDNYDVTFILYNDDQSLDSYYPVTISNIQLDYNTGPIELDDIVLNKINDYNIVVSSDGTNHNSFHRISSAIHYAQHYVFDKNITIAVLPGIYDEHATINWNPYNFNLHIKLTGISNNNEDCILRNTRFLFGDGYGDNYNENDIIENFVFSDIKNSITILEGTPIIRNNTFESCENNSSDQYLHGGAIYCSSSAIIEQNIFTNTVANESLYEIGLGGAIYAETENNEMITIANNEFNNCRSFGGGAIYCTGTGSFEINNNTFTQCSLIDGTFYPEEGLAIYCNGSTTEGQIEIFNNREC